MAVTKPAGRPGRRRRKIVAGAGLIIIMLLAAGIVWGWQAMRPTEPRPLPSLGPGDYAAFEQYADKLITDEMSRQKIVGLSAAVVIGDRVAWARGFGYADREAQVPATPATIYRAGSISKIPNALAVLKFRTEGKIDIDAPLNRYIPEFSIRSRFAARPAITPRLLMTHHAGLPCDIVKGMWGERPDPFQSVVPLLADEYSAYPPGTIYSYGNLGASLLGVMLERVSGQEYAAVVQDAVLRPLEMGDSSYAALPQGERQLARGYNQEGRPEREVSPRDVPASNLYTSVQDLSNMMIMLLNDGVFNGRRFLPADAVREMLSPQNGDVLLDGNFQIGYEFFLNKAALAYAGGSFGHGGYMYLFNSQAIGLKEHKIAVVVMANSAGSGNSVNRIAEQLLKGAVAVKTGLLPPTDRPVYEAGRLPAGVRQTANCAGDYGTIIGLLQVRSDGAGGYSAEIMGKRFVLEPDEGPWWRLQYRLGGVLPLPHPKLQNLRVAFLNIDGEDVVFGQNGPDFLAVGKRIGRYEVSETWRGRQGLYRTSEAENQLLKIDHLELRVNDAGFIAIKVAAASKHADLGEMVLYPLNDQEAVIYGLGRRMMETVRVSGELGRESIVLEGISFEKQQ